MEQKYIDRMLAMANNLYWTSRPDISLSVLQVVKRFDPHNQMVDKLHELIVADTIGTEKPDLSDFFGSVWRGESLKGKSLLVFLEDQLPVDSLQKIKGCQIFLSGIMIPLDWRPQRYEQVKIEAKALGYDFVDDHLRCDYHTSTRDIEGILLATGR